MSVSTRVVKLLAWTTSLALAEGCGGPGPLTPLEVRWRWQHGAIRQIEVVDGGVRVAFSCPVEHGLVDGQPVEASAVLLTREVREFERRDPLLRRDPFRMVAWRRCADEAEFKQKAAASAAR